MSSYQMFEILPNLYLSKFPKEIPATITHDLNMYPNPHPADATRTYLHIDNLLDIDDITPYIPQIITFISTALQNGGRILIHCHLGLNRSVAATITYLCHIKQIDADEALKFVKSRKSDVTPSNLFLGQIDRYFGRTSMEREDPMVLFKKRLEARKRGGIVNTE